MTFYYKQHSEGYVEFYTDDYSNAVELSISENETNVEPVKGWDNKYYLTEADIPPKSPERLQEEIKGQIAELEAQQTPRRLREAALGDVGSIAFLQDIEDEIEVLRGQI